jgi:hypothetical protein
LTDKDDKALNESQAPGKGTEAYGGDQDSEAPAGGDELIHEEEEAAAGEAAEIGGRSGMEDMEEAERGAAEHGAGEAEGFEQAEQLLEGQATHGDPALDPQRNAPEAEEEKDSSVHGEADQVDSTDG